MGTRVIASQLLANGLTNEFDNMYSAIQNRQAQSWLASVMDLSLTADNRTKEMGYFQSAPFVSFWERNTTVPIDAMKSVQFTAVIHEWAKRVGWSKFDRQDERTQSLTDSARQTGESFALLPEVFFFDLLQGSTELLPVIPNAPDGVGFFSGTDGDGGARFGASGGNLLSRSGTTAAQIRTDYYAAMTQFKSFTDTKSQPLYTGTSLDAGVIIIHPNELTEEMEEAFIQTRNVDTTGSGATNVVIEANRTVQLISSARLTDADDWFVFLKNPPKQSTFFLDRSGGVQEFSSLEGDNNSDTNRDTGEEYLQWESRSGAGISLPYGAIKMGS